jgi:hypothetical protein
MTRVVTVHGGSVFLSIQVATHGEMTNNGTLYHGQVQGFDTRLSIKPVTCGISPVGHQLGSVRVGWLFRTGQVSDEEVDAIWIS